GSILRRGRWAWIVSLLPLLFANIVGAPILLVALGVWAIGRSAPSLVEAWRSRVRHVDRPRGAGRHGGRVRRRPPPRRDRHPRLSPLLTVVRILTSHERDDRIHGSEGTSLGTRRPNLTRARTVRGDAQWSTGGGAPFSRRPRVT